ncbi:MAG: LacI family transcriptional regulator [Chloroflexota bacterium]|nr:LacI family transcriptional regulator [Chloroflexota bacterium]
MRVTIRDVAYRAGVSNNTVSRVLNDRPDVSPATRVRIQNVIEELGYRPNSLARSLLRRESRTVGLVVTGVIWRKGKYCTLRASGLSVRWLRASGLSVRWNVQRCVALIPQRDAARRSLSGAPSLGSMNWSDKLHSLHSYARLTP